MVRPHELECCHGVGHQMGVHGCDGCCGLIFGGLVDQEQERIIKLLEERTEGSGSVLDETGNSIADLSDLIALIKAETNG